MSRQHLPEDAKILLAGKETFDPHNQLNWSEDVPSGAQ